MTQLLGAGPSFLPIVPPHPLSRIGWCDAPPDACGQDALPQLTAYLPLLARPGLDRHPHADGPIVMRDRTDDLRRLQQRNCGNRVGSTTPQVT